MMMMEMERKYNKKLARNIETRKESVFVEFVSNRNLNKNVVVFQPKSKSRWTKQKVALW
jgi:hypothetical protein